jgi:MFS family permease
VPVVLPAAPVARSRAVAVVLPFCLGYFVSYVLRAVNAVIAPELSRELGLDAAGIGFLTSTYSLTFALAQLPVGLALDRFGARRVVGLLLLVAAAGTVVFAAGHSFVSLAIGRGLAGLGVSACLMGGFKVFGEAFADRQQASLTGIIMAAGTAGAVVASAPLAWALPWIGWRGALLVVAGLAALAAALVLVAVPPTVAAGHRGEGAAVQARAVREVMRAAAFWHYAPQALLFTGGFMALQGLWFVTWLMLIDGQSRAGAAGLLLVLNVGLLVGQAAIALGATALHAAGISRQRLMNVGLVLAIAVEALLVARVAGGPVAWFALGLFTAVGAQVYGLASRRFPPHLAGRVTTALNLLAFTGAFIIQWGVGIALERLGGTPGALRAIFAAIVLAQGAAVAWTIARSRAR